jgi:hypothetical protein
VLASLHRTQAKQMALNTTALQQQHRQRGYVRILQYNIFDGCTDAHRLRRLGDWLKTRQYDIITFNELNNWDANKLRAIGMSWGFGHSDFFETKVGYHLGVLSRLPIIASQHHTKGFHHGLLYVAIELQPKRKPLPQLLLHLLVTHMTPKVR